MGGRTLKFLGPRHGGGTTVCSLLWELREGLHLVGLEEGGVWSLYL